MRRGKIERKIRAKDLSTKAKSARSTMATDATAPGLAKKARSFSIVGANRVCSNGGGEKNECSNGMPKSVSRVCALMGFTYHRYRQRK